MSDVAIRVESLGKRYRIGAQQAQYKTLRESLVSAVTRTLRSRADRQVEREAATIWALKEVSFEVKRGEAVGIIGRNGAGKSTLLKIMSRITRPTEGYAEVHGRVGSLLEVGTGFHPELTGRENIFLNGAILGMKRAELARKFDEIVAFAEIERFLDTPVKRYSSGMYVRLAFAVAAHLETEILVVDEVLAVGDTAFQQKCLDKMNKVAKGGRTVLFVSHNMQAISSLTQRTLVLDKGHKIFDGDTYPALTCYRSLWGKHDDGEYIDARKKIGVVHAKVITSDQGQRHQFGLPLTFDFEIVFEEEPKAESFSFQVIDEEMRPITYLSLFDSDKHWARKGRVLLRCLVPNPRIYMGRYSVVTWLGNRSSLEIYENLQGICPFEIVMDGIQREYDWQPGVATYLENAEWQVI